MDTENIALLAHVYHGSKLALAVMAHLRFGLLPTADQFDDDHCNAVIGALVTNGDTSLFALANRSSAIRAATEELEALGEAGLARIDDITAAASTAFLHEFGGFVGIEAECARLTRAAHAKAMATLRPAVTPMAQSLSELLGANVTTVEIGPDTNLDEALAGLDLPDTVKEKLKALGESAQTASAAAEAKDKTLN